jgi:glutamate racemase
LRGEQVSDEAIAAEIAPASSMAKTAMERGPIPWCSPARTIPADRPNACAGPWTVDWIDPAPAIARRVGSLLGPPNAHGEEPEAQFRFTSGQAPNPVLAKALEPFICASVAT